MICVRTGLARAEVRSHARTVLREALAAWSHLPPDKLPLKETPRGPVWESELQGDTLNLSLSYEDGEAWIALRRGGFIGVDVMHLKLVEEAEAVAQTYFSPIIRAALRQSTDPIRDFALAWTQLEARCKCFKEELVEWPESAALQARECIVRSLIVEDRLALSVATAPQPKA